MVSTTNHSRRAADGIRRTARIALFVGMIAVIAVLSWSVAPQLLARSISNEVTGLRATLVDDVRPFREQELDRLRWQTFWLLEWQPVSGAVDYIVTFKTSEGVSRQPKIMTESRYRVEVAKGDNLASAGLFSRDIQLSTIQSLLSVSIAPRFADGRVGRASPYIEVGRPLT